MRSRRRVRGFVQFDLELLPLDKRRSVSGPIAQSRYA
jgi:hypothetical protein